MKKQAFTVTAALPYANGPLHLGHVAGVYLPADLFVRFLRLKKDDVLFICGSDEHGAAITLRAKKEGINTITKFKMHFSALRFPLIFITAQAVHFTTRSPLIFSKHYTKKTPLLRKLPCSIMMNLFINFLPIDTLLEPVRNASTLPPTATNAKNVVLI
jgi:leucyl-tRNA synthetase